MRLILTIIISFVVIQNSTSLSQTWEERFDETVRLSNEGKYEEAITQADLTIEPLVKDIGKHNQDYCYILTWKAQNLSLLDRKRESLVLFNEALSLAEELFNENDPNLGQIQSSVATVYFELQEYQNALVLFLKATKNALINFGTDHKDFLYRQSRLGQSYMYLDRLDDAMVLFEENLLIAERMYGNKPARYYEHLYNKAMLYRLSENYEKAIPLYDELIEASKTDESQHPIEKALFQYDLGLIYNHLKEYDKVIPLAEVSFELIKPYYSPNHWFYYERERNLGLAYQNANQPEKALKYYEEAVQNAKSIFGEEDPRYAQVLFDFGANYVDLKQYEKAFPPLLQSVRILRDSLGKEDQTFKDYFRYVEVKFSEVGQNLIVLDLYSTNYEYEKALNFLIQLMVVMHESKSDPLELVDNYLPSFHFWLKMGDNHFSEFDVYKDRFFKLMMDATANGMNLENHTEWSYLAELFSVIGQYVASGSFNEGLLLLERVELIASKNKLMTDELRLSIDLSKADIYSLLGQPERAFPLLKESLQHKGKSGWMEEMSYSSTLMNLGSNALARNEDEEAFTYFQEAYQLIKPYGEKSENDTGKFIIVHSEYPEVLSYLSSYYSNKGELDSSFIYLKKALNYTEKYLAKTEQLCLIYNNLGAIYFHKKDYPNAEKYYLLALKGYQDFYGDRSEYASLIKSNLCLLYDQMGKMDEAIALLIEIKDLIQQNIQKNFAFLAEQQKISLIKEYNSTFDYFKGLALKYMNRNPELSGFAYNIELTTKGMVLNSSIEMRQIIEGMNDSIAKNMFAQWTALNAELTKEYALPVNERSMSMDEMERRAEKLENDLMRLSSKVSSDVPIGSISWQDIQKGLKPNETAIEFATYAIREEDERTDISYMAILIDKQLKQPKMIPLFKQADLDSILKRGESSDVRFVNSIYRGDSSGTVTMSFKGYAKLYDLIWGAIEKHVPEGNTVYYSPVGSLHQLAFSAIAKGDSVLSDHYKLVQLSSTAEIIKSDQNLHSSKPKDIALFGGINYTLSSTEIGEMQKESTPTNLTSSNYFSDESSRGGEWNFLPGTLKEIQEIESRAKKKGVKTGIYTTTLAREDVFKSFSGHSPEVIHISTHGFFFPDPDKRKSEIDILARQNSFNSSDDPMNRSGLLFSGANHTWVNDGKMKGFEDGILTAKEVSYLSLGNTELVVLSACETGLGKVNGSEGVFGLQRAFKAAGVNYLLMSLWKVPDKETAEFMVKFYDTWLAGSSIQDAFQQTQSYMKEKYYNEPYKWAAFVLMR